MGVNSGFKSFTEFLSKTIRNFLTNWKQAWTITTITKS